MADNLFIPACDCDGSAFSALPTQNINCPFDAFQSEIQGILLSDTSQPTPPTPADWNLEADWDAVIDNADATGAKIKYLLGIGNVTSGEPTVRIMPGFRNIFGETTYTLTFNLLDMDPQIHTFLQNLENCPSMPRIWFITVDGIMFGAPTGIVTSSKRFPFVLNEGEDSYETNQLIFEWKAKTRPMRITSPI